MGVEFLLEENKPSRHCHQLDFRFSVENNVYNGTLAFTPKQATVYMERAKRVNRILFRLQHLVSRLGITYDTLFAKLALETPYEFLERDDGLVTAVKMAFPKANLTEANKNCLVMLVDSFLFAVDGYTALTKVLPEAELKGEDVIDFIINAQGKIFDLSFYNKLRKGIRLNELLLAFAEPLGVLKGVLLKEGYIPYLVRGNRDVRYIHNSVPAPDNLMVTVPFKSKPL